MKTNRQKKPLKDKNKKDPRTPPHLGMINIFSDADDIKTKRAVLQQKRMVSQREL